jgi:hypothetical protein
MLFVIKKRDLQHALSVVRDDRNQRKHPGSFMRLEARHDYLLLSSWDASAQIAATVYEPGVVFLRVKILRRLLPTIKHSKFLEIKVTADEMLLDNVRLSLAVDDKLLYDDPQSAPPVHPEKKVVKKRRFIPTHRQLRLWSRWDARA